MKPWMRALVWLGLGGGIGFFAGFRFGYKKDRDEIFESAANVINENDEIWKQRMNEALEAQKEYLGARDDKVVDEDPEMPEVPEMPDDLEDEDDTDVQNDGDTDGDEEIQPFHPEDLRPFGISSSEYIRNEQGYDKIQLDFYTEDGVIFDPEREERWTHPEQLLGLGWRARFISNDDRVSIREAYIQNDTMGTLYKITRIDDSFERLYEEE